MDREGETVIEWLPRRPFEGDGWVDLPTRDKNGLLPRSGVVQGATGVIVPVQRYDAQVGNFLGDGLSVVAAGGMTWAATGAHQAFIPAAGAVLWGVVGVRRAGHRLLSSKRQPSLALGETGVETGGLFVPWSAIEEVVTFHARGVDGDGKKRTWNHLALRVRDFDAVVGLTPSRAGLANLTRRRLVLVADAGELTDPRTVASALRLLVKRPEARLLLSGPEGVRLLTVGALHGSS